MTTPTDDLAQAFDPHEFGCGIENSPKAAYWQERARLWRDKAIELGYGAPDDSARESRAELASALHVLFDGPPGPTAGRFVEVEDDSGKSINAGEWKRRDDGYWELVIPRPAQPAPQRERGGRMKAFGKSFLHAIRVAILIVLIVCLSPLIVAALALNAIGMLWETTW